VNEFKNGGGRMAPLDNLLASNFIHHFSNPKLPAGKEGFKAIDNMIFKAFPDVVIKYNEGDGLTYLSQN
jgi:hypothetical protein